MHPLCVGLRLLIIVQLGPVTRVRGCLCGYGRGISTHGPQMATTEHQEGVTACQRECQRHGQVRLPVMWDIPFDSDSQIFAVNTKVQFQTERATETVTLASGLIHVPI